MEESKNELIINIDNGVIDFNALIKRVKDLEEMITKILAVVFAVIAFAATIWANWGNRP